MVAEFTFGHLVTIFDTETEKVQLVRLHNMLKIQEEEEKERNREIAKEGRKRKNQHPRRPPQKEKNTHSCSRKNLLSILGI